MSTTFCELIMETKHQLNYLLPSKATLNINGSKAFSINMQQFKIPRLYAYISEQPTPLLSIPIRGNKMVYDLLEVSYIIDENLEAWVELYTWMTELYSPSNTKQYKEKTQDYVDGFILVYSSSNNPILRVEFKGLFPVKIDEVGFDIEEPSTEPVKSKVEFAFMSLEVKKV